ncbi:MAG: glycerol-3-phosphate responsive antiterminator [Ruminococcaceae bacterium]|nr:glycerol-3-phosphate responsive antiterminator [Oscillospiraceae bacterium]
MLDFDNYPIIAAVRSDEDLEAALKYDVQTIFLLSSGIMTIDSVLKKGHDAGKLIFVHMDFIQGISNDAPGVKFLATKGIDGIISTRANIISAAHDCGIDSVQRFFMIDSRSVETALETIRASRASMVEIMPGIAYKSIEKIKRNVRIPIIAGGLIEHKEEVFKALSHGASAVSTGKRELWGE